MSLKVVIKIAKMYIYNSLTPDSTPRIYKVNPAALSWKTRLIYITLSLLYNGKQNCDSIGKSICATVTEIDYGC